MENSTIRSVKKPFYKRWWFWAVIIIIIYIFFSFFHTIYPYESIDGSINYNLSDANFNLKQATPTFNLKMGVLTQHKIVFLGKLEDAGGSLWSGFLYKPVVYATISDSYVIESKDCELNYLGNANSLRVDAPTSESLYQLKCSDVEPQDKYVKDTYYSNQLSSEEVDALSKNGYQMPTKDAPTVKITPRI
ncbi:MAG: hypothetical protein PHV93_00565 [Candidatus Pacebacteria bacterium]|nr:hypothetical protein [Candidatus Paceibacterota bacterium]